MYRWVYFSAEKHNFFSEIANDNTSNGIEIKRFRISDINEDVIMNDFTSVKRTEVYFERKTFHAKPSSIQQINNECVVYDIVDITGLIYNIFVFSFYQEKIVWLILQMVTPRFINFSCILRHYMEFASA